LGAPRPSSIIVPFRIIAGRAFARRQGWSVMLHVFLRTLVKVTIASLIVGTVLAHFGITADQIIGAIGLSQQRLIELAERAASWALPNLLLGSLVIVPIWFLLYLFRPPGRSSSSD
jgi:hypothetical protein